MSLKWTFILEYLEVKMEKVLLDRVRIQQERKIYEMLVMMKQVGVRRCSSLEGAVHNDKYQQAHQDRVVK